MSRKPVYNTNIVWISCCDPAVIAVIILLGIEPRFSYAETCLCAHMIVVLGDEAERGRSRRGVATISKSGPTSYADGFFCM